MVHLIDNFLTDPLKEREEALKATYETVKHNKLTYRGISVKEDPESFEKIEKILGYETKNRTCFYRRYIEDEENETYIHSDALIGSYTGILFLNLNEQCQGGTAFWKHKKYGFDSAPTEGDLKKVGLENNEETFDKLYEDGFDESLWQMTEFAPMVFNRLVLFHSTRYHSRYPKKAFGTNIETSRLVKVFFGKL